MIIIFDQTFTDNNIRLAEQEREASIRLRGLIGRFEFSFEYFEILIGRFLKMGMGFATRIPVPENGYGIFHLHFRSRK